MNSYIVDKRDILNGVAHLDREESRHAVMVMRLKPGEETILCDGEGGRYRATAESCSSDGVTLRVTGELPTNESPANIKLLIGCLKSDKLELVIQKLTEIGVNEIIPVRMARCVAVPDFSNKMERLRKIAREAVKQSKRGRIPVVKEPVTWKRALEVISETETAIMPWEEATNVRMSDVYRDKPSSRDIAVIIGPEGGITCDEASQAQEAGAVCVTLGSRILRAETAAICAATAVQSLWGDM